MFSGDNLFTLIVAVLCVVVFFTGLRQIRRSFAVQRKLDALGASGVTTQAKITYMGQVGKTPEEAMRSTTKNTYGGPSYFVDYEFSVPVAAGEPKRYKRHLEVRPQAYSNYKVGDEVTIVYLPNNPNSSRIQGGQAEARTPTTLRLTGILLTVGGLGFGIYMAVRLLTR